MVMYVNGEKVALEAIEAEVERLRPHYFEQVAGGENSEDHEKRLYEWSRENMVERVLMRQAAVNDPAEVPAEMVERGYQQVLEQHGGEEQFYEQIEGGREREGEIKQDIELRIRLERLLEGLTKDVAEPGEGEIQKYFDDNVERFTAPEMVHAFHIVQSAKPDTAGEDVKKEMERLLKKIRGGVDFSEMAREHSGCSDDNGGDLGFFPRGQMVQAFEDVVFAMETGDVSDVFETEFGYHIAKVAEKKESRPVSLDEARQVIVNELTNISRQKAIEEFLDVEKEKATIEEKDQ